MEETHVLKAKLKTHRTELSKLILGKPLLRSEYGWNIFDGRLRAELEDKFEEDDDQEAAMGSFIDSLVETGPEGYRKFISGLVVTGHFEPVRLLEPDMDVISKYEELSAATAERGGFHESSSAPSRLCDRLNERSSGDGCLSGDDSFDGESSMNGAASKTNGDEIDTQKTSDSVHDRLKKESLAAAASASTVESIALAERFYNGLPRNDTIYKMEENPRGFVLIVENDTFRKEYDSRPGSDRDSNRLKDVFEQLYFTVLHKKNLGLSNLKVALSAFTKRRDHADACFVFILSHGKQVSKNKSTKDVIISWEGKKLETDWILKRFSNQNAPSLKGKPKVLAFQACRGDRIDVLPGESRLETDGSFHYWSDLMVLHATVPGFASIRHVTDGTWFIQELCNVIRDQSSVLHFKKIADETIRRVKQRLGGNDGIWIQAPEYTVRGGFEKLYFNPGLSSVDNIRVKEPFTL